jgi:hypothetical protein
VSSHQCYAGNIYSARVAPSGSYKNRRASTTPAKRQCFSLAERHTQQELTLKFSETAGLPALQYNITKSLMALHKLKEYTMKRGNLQ